MSHSANETGGAGPSHRGVEIGVALVIAALGFVSIFGSLKVGVGWGAEGPRAGFFPFYVGILVVIACVINLIAVFRTANDGALFAEWSQLRQVLAVVVPTAIYVACVPFLGIYVSSAALIAVFMKWLGGYRWIVLIPISIGVPVMTFFMFEIWFLVPLPKGPLESFLGY